VGSREVGGKKFGVHIAAAGTIQKNNEIQKP